jgi:hypothetical protein
MTVDEGRPDDHIAGDAAPACAFCGDRLVPFSLETPDVSPVAPIGDVAEFLHVGVDRRAGMLVLITANGLTGADIDVAETVDPTPGKDRMNRPDGHSQLSADTDRAEPLLPPQMHGLSH